MESTVLPWHHPVTTGWAGTYLRGCSHQDSLVFAFPSPLDSPWKLCERETAGDRLRTELGYGDTVPLVSLSKSPDGTRSSLCTPPSLQRGTVACPLPSPLGQQQETCSGLEPCRQGYRGPRRTQESLDGDSAEESLMTPSFWIPYHNS